MLDLISWAINLVLCIDGSKVSGPKIINYMPQPIWTASAYRQHISVRPTANCYMGNRWRRYVNSHYWMTLLVTINACNHVITYKGAETSISTQSEESIMTIRKRAPMMYHSPETVLPMLHRRHPTLPGLLLQLHLSILFRLRTKLDHNTVFQGMPVFWSIFSLTFWENIYQALADQMNLYATQQPPGRSYHRVHTSIDKTVLFLGIHQVMGVHELPSVEDYQSMHPFLIVLWVWIRAYQYIDSRLCKAFNTWMTP